MIAKLLAVGSNLFNDSFKLFKSIFELVNSVIKSIDFLPKFVFGSQLREHITGFKAHIFELFIDLLETPINLLELRVKGFDDGLS